MDSPDTLQEEDSVFEEDGDETKSSTDKECQQETEHDSTETKDESHADSQFECDTQRDRDSGTFSMGTETPTESSGSLSQLDSLSQRVQKLEQDLTSMSRQNEMMKTMMMQQSFLRVGTAALEAALQEHQKLVSLLCSASSLNLQMTSSCGAPPAPPPPPPDAAPDFTSSATPRIKTDIEKNLSKNGVSFVVALKEELERRRLEKENPTQNRRMTFCAVTEHSASTEIADNLKRTNSTGDLRQEDGEKKKPKSFQEELLDKVKERRSSVHKGKTYIENGELIKKPVAEDPEQESET